MDNDKENLAVLDSLWNMEHKTVDSPTNINTSINLSYNFYPNPVVSQLTVEYYLENSTPINITIHAMDGRLIKDIPIGNQDRGLHTQWIDCSNLSKGTYILRIEANNSFTSDKFIKK